MNSPVAAPLPPSPPPTARVADVRDALLALLHEPPEPVLPSSHLARRLRCALGLLKYLELADIEARLVELERTAGELKRQPAGYAAD